MKKGILGLMILSILMVGCSNKSNIKYAENTNLNNGNKIEESVDSKNDIIKKQQEEEERKKREVKEITISSVGDIMMHKAQIDAGKKADGTYDFSAMFKGVKPYIEKSDFSVANLETTLSGKEKEYTGYPCFNSPEILAQNIKDTGFDLVTTANNHSLDRKFYGVQKTIENLDNVGLLHTGTFKSEEDSKNIMIEDIKGVKVAFLVYTYATNNL